jgi:hypothetical protein
MASDEVRLASSEVVAEAVGYAHADLDRIKDLWRFVAEQKLLGSWLAGQIPENWDTDGQGHRFPVGVDISGLPSPEAHSDPTGEQVCTARPGPEAEDQRAMLAVLRSIDHLGRLGREFEHTVKTLRRARVALAARVPAVDAAINAHERRHTSKQQEIGVGPDGRVGTSGVTLDEADRQRKGAVESEAACLVCDLGVSQVGRLKAGLCETDYKAWSRAGQPDRGTYQDDDHCSGWLAERRRYLADKTEVLPDELAARRARLQAAGLDEDLAA